MSQLISKILEDKSLQWDVYRQRAQDAEIHLRENRIESIRFPILSEGFAARIIRPKEGGAATGIGIGPGNLIENERDVMHSVEFAKNASKLTTFPSYELPSGRTKVASGVKIIDSRIQVDLMGAAKDLAERAMSLMGTDSRVRVSFCKIRLTEIRTTLENCNGLQDEKVETFAYFEAGLSPTSSSERGERLAEYWPRVLARRLEDLQLERDIPRWSKFARDSPKAQPPETGDYSLIVPSEVLSEMVPPVVSFHSSASALKKGMSKWREPGQKVWNERVTIWDDGLLDYGLSTSAFDDEGTPQQRTEIIRNGEFRGYITNRMYAPFVPSTGGSTGNGSKASRAEGVLCYGDDVELKHTNIVMSGGDSDIDEMVKETPRGVFVEQFSWMLPDPLTGNFGAEIRHAYLVENGQVTHPLKGGVVNGSFFGGENSSGDGEIRETGVFDSLDLISRERRMVLSSLLPSLRFPLVRVSG